MEQVGASQACLDMSTQYSKERIQFGRPIGSFQAIQHQIVIFKVYFIRVKEYR